VPKPGWSRVRYRGTVYRLRVILSGISPMIWRQLEVPATLTLADLHEVLQTAFGWSGERLHRFTVHGRDYGSAELGWAEPSAVGLAGLGLRERERFTYAYDFFSPLQCWRHDLRVEAVTAAHPRRRYPWCSGGARTAPPQDCGGPEAFLALRQEHGRWATTVRMAELIGLLLARQRETGLGGQRAGQRLDLGHLHRGEPAWASRPGQVLQPRDAVRGEPSAPLTHRVHADPQIGGGRCVRAPGGRGQHDPSPDHVAVGTTPGPGTGGQHRDLQLGKHNHERAVDPHASLSQPTPPPEEGDTPMAPRLSARR